LIWAAFFLPRQEWSTFFRPDLNLVQTGPWFRPRLVCEYFQNTKSWRNLSTLIDFGDFYSPFHPTRSWNVSEWPSKSRGLAVFSTNSNLELPLFGPEIFRTTKRCALPPSKEWFQSIFSELQLWRDNLKFVRSKTDTRWKSTRIRSTWIHFRFILYSPRNPLGPRLLKRRQTILWIYSMSLLPKTIER
jgi:hypothetical protein